MSATNFKTENNTYRKLIGNGLTYRIPRFQRDYSWTDEEWEDLWSDILGTVQTGGEPAHYMGYLVLQSQDDKTFDVISVTDELNAYKVFETLNARGVRLSSTDLLKNYLFSVLNKANQHAHEMQALEDRWESMVSRLGAESFPDFLRTHWISRKTFVRQSDIFNSHSNPA